MQFELGTLVANSSFAYFAAKSGVGKQESMGILRPLK